MTTTSSTHTVLEMDKDTTGQEFAAGPDDEGRRLDKILRHILPDLSLSQIYSGLRKAEIRVNGHKVKADYRLSAGDRIQIGGKAKKQLQPASAAKAESKQREADPSELEELKDIIVLATKDLLFLNKARGELSQDGSQQSQLVLRVKEALAARRADSLSFSPAALHRLDRNTSGILTFPLSALGARVFTEMLRSRKIKKLYLALVDGKVIGDEEWEDFIQRDQTRLRSEISTGEDAKKALASMHSLIHGEDHSLLLIELHTGLTHQIRVQASSRGHPLSGDRKYGGSPDSRGYLLHAYVLAFSEKPLSDLPSFVLAPLPREAEARLSAEFGPRKLAEALNLVKTFL